MTNKALLAGINAYMQSPLRGCINDVLDVENYLLGKNFQCTKLLDSSATKPNILNGLNTLINGSHAGDVLVWYFSGHGSYILDNNGDETDDQYDECLISYDYFTNGNFIRDDDLAEIFTRIPEGVLVECIHDSCFSGDSTKLFNDLNSNTRFVDIDTNSIDLKSSASKYIPIQLSRPKKKVVKIGRIGHKVSNITMNHILSSACGETQTSSEVRVNGQYRGIFTYLLTRRLRLSPTMSRSGVISNVRANLAALGLSQIPMLECIDSEKLEPYFS